jgi:hypothetical protein
VSDGSCDSANLTVGRGFELTTAAGRLIRRPKTNTQYSKLFSGVPAILLTVSAFGARRKYSVSRIFNGCQ